MNRTELKAFLDEKAAYYEQPAFLEQDPIQIPHRYTQKEDIEISGFLTAVIAWGNRLSILRSADKMMQLMGNAPYDFVVNHQPQDLENMEGFVHRTFQAVDLQYFLKALQQIYRHQGGLETTLAKHYKESGELQLALSNFKKEFFSFDPPARSLKHLPDPIKGSAAKRINMYLRWMVRPADRNVDFGIWDQIPAAALSCPLDVHSGRVARAVMLLKRKQNDAKAVAELDKALRRLDPLDPVKYDFALFGLGVDEKF
ncbi:TIGR02757 family protein [Gilvibacter sediminis]|uniref:TIGR02757 family protein n=1 Tax=Gilvibacter sediminis TaxID=379071 RepID=UPI00234FB72A|nr:TIGR02757 family protein [Gilvibacter sediminis]MDC7998233.1 TIGR02757 family protein [Gilvibacter sediminis]